MKETIVKINKSNRWFLEKTKEIDKPFNRLIKKKGRRIKSTKLGMKKKKLEQTTQKNKGSRDYNKQLYGNKMDNLKKMSRFLEKFNLKRLNQEEIEIMNKPITSIETETVINSTCPPPPQNKPRPDGATGEFYQTFREELMPTLLKLFQYFA